MRITSINISVKFDYCSNLRINFEDIESFSSPPCLRSLHGLDLEAVTPDFYDDNATQIASLRTILNYPRKLRSKITLDITALRTRLSFDPTLATIGVEFESRRLPLRILNDLNHHRRHGLHDPFIRTYTRARVVKYLK